MTDNVKKINEPKKEEIIIDKPIKKEKPKKHLFSSIFNIIKDKFISVHNIFLNIISNIINDIINRLFCLNILVNEEIQKIKKEQQRLLEEEKKIRERNKKIKEILNKR